VDETSGTNPTDASAERGPDGGQPAESPPVEQQGFRSRGRARRRARFLRRARELAYRDLGGLVYNLHRFGQRNDPLVMAKLNTLGLIDGELRTLEAALHERRSVTVLREAGITACPRCAAIHGSEDRYCPNCGLPMSRHADLPIAGAPAGSAPGADGAAAAPVQPSPAPDPAPAQAPAPQPAGVVPTAASAAAPQPASPSPAPSASPGGDAPGAPGTQRHQTIPPANDAPGRSPSPPSRPAEGEPTVSAGRRTTTEEATEIIRPSGS
jgi:hypothetical protein